MGYKLKKEIQASWLSEKLGLPLYGHDFKIKYVASFSNVKKSNSLVFSNNEKHLFPHSTCCIVIAKDHKDSDEFSFIESKNPRFDFVRSLLLIDKESGFNIPNLKPKIHSSVKLGMNVVIENDVIIGEGTNIGHNVVIKSGTKIGKFCNIQSGAVIGEDGFGYERNEANIPIKMLHLSGVTILDHVHIGSNSTICRGVFEPTLIESYVKVDNLVHISHNCHIKERVIITACAEISGSVVVEEDVWIAPNSSIRQKLVIGSGSLIGLGSVVVKNVNNRVVVMGNPAKIKE